MPTAVDGGRRLRNDIIFISVLLLFFLAVGACFFFLRGDGDTVTVEVNGQLFGTYPLSRDHTVEIRTGDDGEALNLLVIKDGKAYMEKATCPDGICVAHKAVFREGECIVCLPHRVIVTVSSSRKSNVDVAA